MTSSSDCPRSTKSIFDGFGIAVDAVIVAGIDFIGACDGLLRGAMAETEIS